MQISKIQYITNYQSKISHLQQVKQVVAAGVDWVQYRPKETPDDVIMAEGQAIATFCKEHSVIFIMNDNVEIAKKLNADGVHLGKSDMPPAEARKILGNDKIIGGTANTVSEIKNLVDQGVNYVGLGPYKFTATKKNLSPILGLDGYSKILDSLNTQNISIPIIAIGGIKEIDIEPLKNVGLSGLAISSLISEAEGISLKTKEILRIFNNNQNSKSK